MKKQLIKFIRYESNKLIILPTPRGIEYFKILPITFTTPNALGSPSSLTAEQTTEDIAKVQIISFNITFPSDIVMVELRDNARLNRYDLRAFLANGMNWYFKAPRIY